MAGKGKTVDTLIDAAELARRIATGERTVILDVRWALGVETGHADYRAGHLPGAVYVDLPAELAAPGSPAAGRHPLPDPSRFAAAVRRWGVNDGDAVVAYDAVGGTSAARAWWLLRHAGIEDVRLLDGGLQAWVRDGGTLETGENIPAPGNAAAGWGHMPVATLEDVRGWPADGMLLDARAAERYRGETEPIDPRAGHIPGAVSAPTMGNLDEAMSFLPPERLRERFGALGQAGASGPIAVYCGSGVSATHQIAALESAGRTAALYPGSWSQWSADPHLPAATGADPGNPADRATAPGGPQAPGAGRFEA